MMRTPADLLLAMTLPAHERHTDDRVDAGIFTATGEARERELLADDLVVFDDMFFVTLLWNASYSDRVEWLGDAKDALAEAERRRAKWLFAGKSHNQRLAERSKNWQRVGPVEVRKKKSAGIAFRWVGQPRADSVTELPPLDAGPAVSSPRAVAPARVVPPVKPASREPSRLQKAEKLRRQRDSRPTDPKLRRATDPPGVARPGDAVAAPQPAPE